MRFDLWQTISSFANTAYFFSNERDGLAGVWGDLVEESLVPYATHLVVASGWGGHARTTLS